jgi:hypothetical protein
MATSETRTLQRVIGENFKRLRGNRNQEEVADLARRLGLKWTQSTVAAIEAGKRVLSIEEHLLLDFEFPARELWTRPAHVGTVWVGESSMYDAMVFDDLVACFFRKTNKTKPTAFRQRPDRADIAARRKVDRNVAATLAINPQEVSSRALAMWGHGFAEERDLRLRKAGPDAGKGQRMRLAWITRRMTDELKAQMEGKQ